MVNIINDYYSQLTDISNAIQDDLKELSGRNFDKVLRDFGYKYEIIDSQIHSKEEIENIIEKVKKYTGLYIFEEQDPNYLTEDIWKEFKKNMSSNNIPSWRKQAKESKYFYVGKSNRIGQRVQEHIFKCSNSTYALKLNLLESNTSDQIELKYKVHIFYFSSENENKKNAINELVESILHSTFEPSIGSKKINS